MFKNETSPLITRYIGSLVKHHLKIPLDDRFGRSIHAPRALGIEGACGVSRCHLPGLLEKNSAFRLRHPRKKKWQEVRLKGVSSLGFTTDSCLALWRLLDIPSAAELGPGGMDFAWMSPWLRTPVAEGISERTCAWFHSGGSSWAPSIYVYNRNPKRLIGHPDPDDWTKIVQQNACHEAQSLLTAGVNPCREYDRRMQLLWLISAWS